MSPSPSHGSSYGDEAQWEQMIAALVDFDLPRSTAARLVGLPHVTPAMVERWLRYCWLRRHYCPESFHGSNAFLITRLLRNDFPPPSVGALRRLAKRLKAAKK